VSFYVGIDGGGTRSRAVLLDEHGVELARVEGSACAIDPNAPKQSVRAIAPLVRALREAAGVGDEVISLWVGVAGAGRERARVALEVGLRDECVATHVVVGTDVAAAFYAAFGDGPGILVISGTGSVVQGRDAGGTIERAGGWGRVIGDDGSGFMVGMEALRAIARMRDRTGPQTALGAELLPRIGLGDAERLVEWVSSARPGEVAALAPYVCLVASQGDAPAQAIVTEACHALATMTRSVLERLTPWDERPEIVLEGGMIRPDSALREGAIRALGQLPVVIREEPVDAALGAAQLAMKHR